MLLMYDENVRYVTSTLTPGWNRLKPGLRYALLCGDDAPVLFEQGDIGLHIQKHSPWIPKENIRHSYAWVKGAAGPASLSQVTKFTNAVKQEMKKRGVDGMKLGVDFVDINMIQIFKDAKLDWIDGMTPMMEARAVKNQDEHECMRQVGAIGDAAHWEFMKFLKPGLTENQLTAHIMEFLYNIPGMEDVEDVIVSSGPNTWPNWRNFSDRIIKPGDMVFMDLAALTWNGYKSCYYRTYMVGREPTRSRRTTTRPRSSGCTTRSRRSRSAPPPATSRSSGPRPRKPGVTRKKTRPQPTCGAMASGLHSTTSRSSRASGRSTIRSTSRKAWCSRSRRSTASRTSGACASKKC